MLSQSGTERSPGPVTSLPEVDHSLEVVLLNPADRVTEGHVPGDVSASQGLPHDFNDRLGDVLEAVCRGDRAIVRLEQLRHAVHDLDPDPSGQPDHRGDVELVRELFPLLDKLRPDVPGLL